MGVRALAATVRGATVRAATARAATVRGGGAGVGLRRSGWRARLGLVAVVGLIGMGLAGVPGAAQAADPAWSVVPSANPVSGMSGAFNDLSCASASFCMGVGDYQSNFNGDTKTLAERWNGSSWSIVPSANAHNGFASSLLYAVSCVSASFCAAAGAYRPETTTFEPLLETWNGSSWAGVVTPNFIGNLTGVSCVSATSCVAVGYSLSNPSGIKQTMVESWDGTSWTQVTSPDTGAGDNFLTGVTCLSASSCIAVGSERTSNTEVLQTLVESWNGSAWSIVASPSRPGTSGLAGVSCLSASSCTAVGSGSANATAVSKTLVETWNGSAWSIVASPNNSTGKPNYLTAVSCVTASFCVAGGSQAESWNGSTWSIVSGLGTYAGGAGLGGVVCLSASSCLVAGWDRDAETVQHPVAYSWDGTTWSAVPAPQHQAFTDALSGLSCPSASFCAAVGSNMDSLPNGIERTLAESWNGSAWSAVPSPNHFQGSTENFNMLDAVSCLSATACTAVGNWRQDTSEKTPQALVESWNGTKWSIVTSPDAGGTGDTNMLAGVSCVSASFCTAVGSYYPSIFNEEGKPLVETWNGTKWSVVPAPLDGATSSLDSVSCVSASSCTAVGSFLASSGSQAQTLVESWNGTTWSLVSSPNMGTADEELNELNGVSCVSASSCTAVGQFDGNTLVESWDGTTWSIVTSPNGASFSNNNLDSVSCVSASSCTATGSSGSGTLVESWDGTAWSVVTSPDGPVAPATDNALLGVSCLAASCTAAGGYTSSTNQLTLIESNA
jgi:hypothetical protein